MSLDPATVRRIATLARIHVDDAEIPQLQSELNGILGWIEQLNEVNIEGVKPLTGAAQMALTKAMSMEGAPHNVLVNSLHVGVIVSDQIKRRFDRERPNVSFEQYVADAGKGVPMGRMGKAEEFANVATFLASDAAGYVTGCAINVDGGRSPVV